MIRQIGVFVQWRRGEIRTFTHNVRFTVSAANTNEEGEPAFFSRLRPASHQGAALCLHLKVVEHLKFSSRFQSISQIRYYPQPILHLSWFLYINQVTVAFLSC